MSANIGKNRKMLASFCKYGVSVKFLKYYVCDFFKLKQQKQAKTFKNGQKNGENGQKKGKHWQKRAKTDKNRRK